MKTLNLKFSESTFKKILKIVKILELGKRLNVLLVILWFLVKLIVNSSIAKNVLTMMGHTMGHAAGPTPAHTLAMTRSARQEVMLQK
jgi:hypothetical protein